MKRFLFYSLALFSAMSMTVSGQMRVTPSGQVRIGYNTDNPQAGVEYDPQAGLVIVGPWPSTSNGGHLAFGPGSKVVMGESPIYPDALMIDADNGILFRKGHKPVFRYGMLGSTDYSDFEFLTNLKAPAMFVLSDSRLKTDVTVMDGEGNSLMQLTPVRYRFKDYVQQSPDGDEVAIPLSESGERFGFIAQEVREVFPELVSEDSQGYLSVDYIGFIPVLVDEIKSLREEISSLKASARKEKENVSGKGSVRWDAALHQNRPNPFNVSSEIDCVLPSGIQEAFVYIYDLQGKQIHKMSVEGRGATSVHVDASSLSPGMYIYTLIADGIEVDSKRMIVTD